MHVQSVQIYCFSLSNIQIYDVLIASSSWLRKLPNDLLLCVYVVVKTLNLEISRCHLADYVKRKPARAARLFFLIQPIRSMFSGVVVAVDVILP